MRGLKKRFGTHEVLRTLDLEIAAGERVALIGQNGLGKTTLLRCLLGLYTGDGVLTVGGLDPRRDRREVLRFVGFVPQLPPGIRATVAQYLHVVTRLCEVTSAAIRDTCETLGLTIDDLAHKPFYALSGGMKQKLLIGVALARRPRLLILDEPAANLDPRARGAFFEALSRLDESTTMLLTSHRVDELSGLVTRLVELDSGEVVLDDVVAAAPALDRTLACSLTLERIEPSVEKTLREWGLQPNSSDDSTWQGQVSAVDRFRFLALLTRWSGLVRAVRIEESNP
ncbi:MAG: ABC transporter ATP-binding protein [Deltaproteobacteria bacterium]|nr:ABC transporter ATP-binding protein [Deltaproteobacteria bacterium]